MRPDRGVGPLFQEGRGGTPSGLFAAGAHVFSPRPIHDLLVELASNCRWLWALFAISSRPRCVVRATSRGRRVRVAISTGAGEPRRARFELVVMGLAWSESLLHDRICACIATTACDPKEDDPFLAPTRAAPKRAANSEL